MRSTNLGTAILSMVISFAFAGILFVNMSWIVIAVAFSACYIYAHSRFVAELGRTDLRIERTVLDDMIYAGQPAGMKVQVTNPTAVSVRGTFEDVVPEGCTIAAGTNRSSGVLRPRSLLTLTYSIVPDKRGVHTVPGMRVRRGDEFGLFVEEQMIDLRTDLNAHTYRDSFDVARRMAGREHLEFAGISRTPAVVLREQEFESIREYVPGDRARDIHWKLYTKLNKLMTKVYRKEGSLETMVFVDCGRSMRLKLSKIAKVDHAVDLSMQLSNVLLNSYHPVGVAAFDEISVIGKTSPSLGRNQYDRIVRTLRGIPGATAPSPDAIAGPPESEEPEESDQPDRPTIYELAKAHPDQGAEFLSTLEKLSTKGTRRSLGLGLVGAIKELIANKRGQEQLAIVITDLMSSRDAVLEGARTCRRSGIRMLVIHAYDDWYRNDVDADAADDIETMYQRLEESFKVEAALRGYDAAYLRIGPADTAPLIVRAIRRRKT